MVCSSSPSRSRCITHAVRIGALLLTALLISSNLGTPFATAATGDSLNTSFGIRPEDENAPWITVELASGRSSTFVVMVGNFSKLEATAVTYATNVYSMINGGMGVGLDGEQISGATTWLDYERQSLALQPGTQARIEVGITIPAGTAPGDYQTALVVQPNVDDLRDEQSDPALLMLSRTAMAVVITVPGPRAPAVEIGAASATFSPGATVQTISVALANTGNVRLKPNATVLLADADGAELGAWPLALGSLYAHSATTLEWSPATPLEAGTYLLSVVLDDPVQRIQVRSDPQPVIVAAMPDPVAPEAAGDQSSHEGGSFAIGAAGSNDGSVGIARWPVIIGVVGAIVALAIATVAWMLGQRSARAQRQPAGPPSGGDR